MAELYIGTSGYDYPEWKGIFYPEKLKRKDFLSYYASEFNSLELNGTYYRMPTTGQMQNMKERSEGKIKFAVKAFQDLTHKINLNNYKETSKNFISSLDPLLRDNLLSCVLLQFPQSFHYDIDERKYLDLLLKEFNGLPVAVEMRNNQWQKEKVYEALRERNTGWCITDNPDLKHLLRQEYIATSGISYIRFHGRNSENWYTGNNITRYDYFYTDTELESFIEPIKELLKHTKIVQLFFNNHAKAQAAVNAKKIEMLLRMKT